MNATEGDRNAREAKGFTSDRPLFLKLFLCLKCQGLNHRGTVSLIQSHPAQGSAFLFLAPY